MMKFPDIGYPHEPRPGIPSVVFKTRLKKTRQKMKEKKLDALVIYGDREHFANLHYLTNYDPRFEESLLVILPEGRPILFVGNEGMGYSTVARLDIQRQLYQTFSLLGQPREKVRALDQLLREAGIRKGMHVGEAGWKYFSEAEFLRASEVLDLPYYIAIALHKAVAPGGLITNENAIFLDPEIGLRNILESEQIADFEWVATCNSQGLIEGIRSLRPGMTENEAFSKMQVNGLPLSCHSTCTSGEMLIRYGMASATSRKIERGDPILMTLSYQGANTCRFGWVARGPKDLPLKIRDYAKRVAIPYFESLAAWYKNLRIGVTGNKLHKVVYDILTPRGFKLVLNIGHQIAADEWTHSLIASGSQQRIHSGMYLQADFFATTTTGHYGAFAEDGVVVADEKLRQELMRHYPAMWKRVQKRRLFMRKDLGIEIGDEFLPFSNFQAAVVPFFLAPEKFVTFTG